MYLYVCNCIGQACFVIDCGIIKKGNFNVER